MTTINLQLRVDSDLKTQAEQLFADLGLDVPTAIRLFLHQALLANGLPFAVSRDPFYGANNQAVLARSMAEVKEGKIIRKSLAELETFAE